VSTHNTLLHAQRIMHYITSLQLQVGHAGTCSSIQRVNKTTEYDNGALNVTDFESEVMERIGYDIARGQLLSNSGAAGFHQSVFRTFRCVDLLRLVNN